MIVESRYVSVGCNRVAGALAWGECGRVAFGGHNAVVLYDTQAAKVIVTLHGHSGRVNCLQWLPSSARNFSGISVLLSGASDGCICIWADEPGGACERSMACQEKIQAHDGPVTTLACHDDGSGGALMVSCAGDKTVKIWNCKERSGLSSWNLAQTVDLGNRLAHCAALTTLPSPNSGPDWLVLAVGMDRNISLMLAAPGTTFQEKFTLTGHQDWVRSLCFHLMSNENGQKELLLASGSQDRNIRIWRATPVKLIADADGPLAHITRLASKHTFSAARQSFTVSLEAVLLGHEDWVHSVAWEPCAVSDQANLPCLLSASMDRTMMLWRPDTTEPGLWMSEESVGDAGSNALGYFGGVFSPSADHILAHGFSGALHLWGRDKAGKWQPQRALGGHFAPVVDCSWVLGGDCLLSASADQTMRITVTSGHEWFELARPQVHGHDFTCVAPLQQSRCKTTSFQFVSGSDEKVLRVFQAPGSFATSLQVARGQDTEDQQGKATDGGSVALGATIGALGLSNKAVYGDEDIAQEQNDYGDYDTGPEFAPNPQPMVVEVPPLEEHLAQSTLWPEVRKLFGHGNDVISLAADPLGFHLASACKSQNSATAAIRIWSTSDWSTVDILKAHTLTVTALEYSPDGRYLLSASRDRSFAVFERQSTQDQEMGKPSYKLIHRQIKAHDRIVWGVSWATCNNHQAVFATCSRDKTIKIWNLGHPAMNDTGGIFPASDVPLVTQVVHIKELQHPVTAISFLTSESLGIMYFAAGFENGELGIYKFEATSNTEKWTAQRVWQAPMELAHCASVRRIRWLHIDEQPVLEACGGSGMQGKMASSQSDHDGTLLATCGDDHKLRVFAVNELFV